MVGAAQRWTLSCGSVRAETRSLRETHRKVLDVLVLSVDYISQVLAVDLLLEHPHADLLFELIRREHIAADNLGDRRAPVARADNGDLLLCLLPMQNARGNFT